MNVLVVNIGSTSFKFRLLEMPELRELARGAVEGVGRPAARVMLAVGGASPATTTQPVTDQAAAVEWCLAALHAPPSGAPLVIDAVGFKAVHGGTLPEAVRVTPEVLRVMDEFAPVAPAHNPAYAAAMRAFAARWPELPLVAAFETGFHRTIPAARRTFAIPYEWTRDFGVQRYGFHGASHRYVAERTAALLGRAGLRLISCHLGGSSSLCASVDGRSVACSLGLTPQSGLPQNNRVGDFEPFALPLLQARTGLDTPALLEALATRGGLLGISGVSGDMRAVLEAASGGDERAALAVDVYVESVRHYLGAQVVALGGLDALTFTGGIGERSAEVRARVCAGLDFLGVRLDGERNKAARPDAVVSRDDSAVAVLAVETNEELIVARQTLAVLAGAA